MMKELAIETSDKTYPVFVGREALGHLPAFLKEQMADASKIWIIADEKVASLYMDKLIHVLSPAYSDKMVITIVPPGEYAKTFAVYESCHKEGLEHQINRKSVVLAFGGGAVGDLAGFVAATYMRGIRFIGIPTTLLAHDSAVGGKTAINHPLGKNMVGAFHQPEAVFYDWSFIHSLPEKELRSGFAEAVKHGLILDEEFYYEMMDNVSAMDDLKGGFLAYILTTGISIKASIVKQDEKEQGVRAFLNFGHTLGHSIEANAGYGKVTHGEAVWIGMLFALHLSMEKTGLKFDLDHFIDWSKQLGYSLSVPECRFEDLVESMKKDKKTTGEEITFVLLEALGKPVLVTLPEDEVLHSLQTFFR
ncbi:3-dehydroquinate synthase [Bacillus sp. 1P06AnD]|uniref:3-dehydroquinate synthase n=1 Tax=Bacillus sp. 1P06AnD TaxID=3132208 RepID=UPI00399F713A